MTPALKKRLKKFNEIDIYPVISSEFCNDRNPVDVLWQIAVGGAKIVQLREKNISKNEIYNLAEHFKKICNRFSMLLIINDHLDIAMSVGADGVHLGQDDFPPSKAKEIAPDLIIGVSTHSKEEALEAQSENAGYINIGPLFATGTKSLSMNPLGTEILNEVSPLLSIPFTVMGGIKEKHIPELKELGAEKIAMVTEITKVDDIAEKVRRLRKLF